MTLVYWSNMQNKSYLFILYFVTFWHVMVIFLLLLLSQWCYLWIFFSWSTIIISIIIHSFSWFVTVTRFVLNHDRLLHDTRNLDKCLRFYDPSYLGSFWTDSIHLQFTLKWSIQYTVGLHDRNIPEAPKPNLFHGITSDAVNK